MKTKAILFTAPEQVSVAPVETPPPAAGELLIETPYTLVSPGAELRCLAGQQPGAIFPFIPGYSLVGRVVSRGPGAALPEGTALFCSGTSQASVNRVWGGHTSYAVYAESDVYPPARRAAAGARSGCETGSHRLSRRAPQPAQGA
jgi:2-desacetyl-2-hydroxyethyl bacteriochlorophyllide A dehydrogenase